MKRVSGNFKFQISHFEFMCAVAVILPGLAAICLAGLPRSNVPGLPQSGIAQHRPRGSTLRIIQLPEAKVTGSLSVEEALAKQTTLLYSPGRRGGIKFSGQALKPAQIGQLAWAGFATMERPPQPPAPAFWQEGAGAPTPSRSRTALQDSEAYPIQLYLATQDGVYLYNPSTHSLQQTLNLDARGGLAAATINPEAVASAGCCLVLASSVRDIGIRSSGKARQLILLQAGHIAQNIQLQAVSLALGSLAIGDFDPRNVRGACNLPRNTEPLYIVAVGYPAEQVSAGPGQDLTTITPPQQIPAGPAVAPLRGSPKAVFIIPAENFQDEELFDTRRFLGMTGALTVVASTKIGPIKGMLGNTAEAAVLIGDLKVDDYDAIIFVGGLGAKLYLNSPVALNIAREAAAKRKVLAAISVAPTILANAGVLRGVRATGFISERVTLERAGARYTGLPVERDGLIITATGPIAANGFARAIADALAGR
ncbi:MAG: DJ-1/PfpI family protein [Sedimentisphaerales bacterium]|nr:DJ-1/PfpI family protein [Sedimentisphaerales bacterium]